MPRGEPTETVRLPRWLVAQLREHAERVGVTLPEYLTRKLSPPRQADTASSAADPPQRRCSCAKPVLSKYATNICTGCGRVRG